MREWSAESDTEKSTNMRTVGHASIGRNHVSRHNEKELYFKGHTWGFQ